MMSDLVDIQAVVFDLDGTLCDSVPDLAVAANAMRTALGLPPLPQEQIAGYVGDGIAMLVHRVLCASADGQADAALWQQGFAAFVRHYADHIADRTRCYPHTEDGLALLQTLGLPLAVVTNKSERLAVRLLKALGLDGYFSIVVGGDTLPERKPAPQPLLHVAEVLGVVPAALLMVGDSRNDILAAKAAGCPSAGVVFGYGDMAALAGDAATRPDWQLSALTEIYERLQAARRHAAETESCR